MEDKNYAPKGCEPEYAIGRPKLPISTICIGDDGYSMAINIDKKFNWFQKKMIEWCFGFEVKENK